MGSSNNDWDLHKFLFDKSKLRWLRWLSLMGVIGGWVLGERIGSWIGGVLCGIIVGVVLGWFIVGVLGWNIQIFAIILFVQAIMFLILRFVFEEKQT